MNVDYDSRSIYIGIKKKANILDSDEKEKNMTGHVSCF